MKSCLDERKLSYCALQTLVSTVQNFFFGLPEENVAHSLLLFIHWRSKQTYLPQGYECFFMACGIFCKNFPIQYRDSPKIGVQWKLRYRWKIRILSSWSHLIVVIHYHNSQSMVWVYIDVLTMKNHQGQQSFLKFKIN